MVTRNGRIMGESYLETYFKKIGINIVRPETLSIQKQVEIYASAKNLIFSEGSAVHGLQLLGRTMCDVFIIKRKNRTQDIIKDFAFYEHGLCKSLKNHFDTYKAVSYTHLTLPTKA